MNILKNKKVAITRTFIRRKKIHYDNSKYINRDAK